RENLPPKASFHELDIRDEAIARLFDRQRFDVVINQAAQMDVRKSVTDPLFDAGVNVIGSLNLLTCAHASGVRKFMFASTGGAIYGEQIEFPAREEHPTSPLSPYGIAKLAVEKYLYFFQHEQGLSTVSLRYANVYGPRQSPHGEAGVVAIFTGKMLKGED